MKIFNPLFLSATSSLLRREHRLHSQINWDRVYSGNYCIVDPFNSEALLYLNETEYKQFVRIAWSANTVMVVLSTPKSFGEEEPHPENSAFELKSETRDTPSSPDSSTSAEKSGDGPGTKEGIASPPASQTPSLSGSESRRSSSVSSSPISGTSGETLQGTGDIGVRKDSPKTEPNQTAFQASVPLGDEDRRSNNSPPKPINWGVGEALKFRSPFWNRKLYPRGDDGSTLVPTKGNLRGLLELWGKTLYVRLGGSVSRSGFFDDLKVVASYFTHILRTEGVGNMIKRMKVGSFAVQSYLSGRPLTNTRELGVPVALCAGLPKFLPSNTRKLIRTRGVQSARLWLSILATYRGLQGAYSDVSFATITNTPYLGETHNIETFIRQFWEWVFAKAPHLQAPDISASIPHMSSKAGPNSPSSILGAGLDALAWLRSKNGALREYLDVTDSFGGWMMFQTVASLVPSFYKSVSRELFLGKVSLKYEAAGKIRVFAIADYWTQFALRPMHDWMFSILKTLPADGTFDQEASLSRLTTLGTSSFWCYDISSATDTIPRVLYRLLLAHVFGNTIAEAWERLLVDREYVHLGPSKKPNLDRTVLARLRYGRGQPMGALSSWGALALVHHLLIQFAAFRVGRFPFSDYAVTGDDSVIAKYEDVAKEYLVVCSLFEIPISLAKSFTTSVGYISYIQQIFLGTENYSPASFKEEISVITIADRIAYMCRLAKRGWSCRPTLGGVIRLGLDFNESQRYLSDLWPKGQLGPKADALISLLLAPGSPYVLGLPSVSGALYSWLLHISGRINVLSHGIYTSLPLKLETDQAFFTFLELLSNKVSSSPLLQADAWKKEIDAFNHSIRRKVGLPLQTLFVWFIDPFVAKVEPIFFGTEVLLYTLNMTRSWVSRNWSVDITGRSAYKILGFQGSLVQFGQMFRGPLDYFKALCQLTVAYGSSWGGMRVVLTLATILVAVFHQPPSKLTDYFIPKLRDNRDRRSQSILSPRLDAILSLITESGLLNQMWVLNSKVRPPHPASEKRSSSAHRRRNRPRSKLSRSQKATGRS
jgi:hypothetical protein